MHLQKGDILIALKAINLTPGIKNGDRAVAAALLDHFNRKTGQCDPGIERLAGLLDCSERTIFRSLNRIEADRLFKRIRHGGHLNRNSYEPNWRRFREIEAVWSARMKPAGSDATTLSSNTGQPCHVGGDNSVTQTCRTNLSKETCQRGLPTKGLPNPSVSRQSVLPASSQEAAHAAAERRWSIKLNEEFADKPTTYAEIIALLDVDIRSAATDAELQYRGGGFNYIVRRLRLGRLPWRGDHG